MRNRRRIGVAVLAAVCISLIGAVGTSFARFPDNTTTWEGVCPPTGSAHTSDYLRQGGQTVRLRDWKMPAAARTLTFTLTAGEDLVDSPVTAQVASGGYLTAKVEPATVTLNKGQSATVQLTLSPTATAAAITENVTTSVRVAWQDLWADVQATLLPEAPSQGAPGETVVLRFSYENIYGLDGILEFSNRELIAGIDYDGSLSGMTGSMDNDRVLLAGSELVSGSIDILVTLKASAQPGEECVITFRYETSDENGTMSDWHTAEYTLTVGQTDTSSDPPQSLLVPAHMTHFDPQGVLALQICTPPSAEYTELALSRTQDGYFPPRVRYSVDLGAHYTALYDADCIRLPKFNGILLLDLSGLANDWQTTPQVTLIAAGMARGSEIMTQTVTSTADVTLPHTLTAPILRDGLPLQLQAEAQWLQNENCRWEASYALLTGPVDGTLKFVPVDLHSQMELRWPAGTDDPAVYMLTETYSVPAGSYRLDLKLYFKDQPVYEVHIPFFVNYAVQGNNLNQVGGANQ